MLHLVHDAGRGRPFEHILRANEVVTGERGATVDRVDEVEGQMIGAEVEWSVKRAAGDCRNIPDRGFGQVFTPRGRDDAIMLLADPLALEVEHHSHTDVAHNVVASATCSATRDAGTPLAYCR